MTTNVYPYQTTKGERRYRIAYRDSQHVQHTKRGFKTKKEAQAYLAEKSVSLNQGTYTDPRAGNITIGELYDVWYAGNKTVWSKSYAHNIDSSWKTHVQGYWSERKLNTIQHSEVQIWVSELAAKRSPTITMRAFGILKGVFEMAVADHRIVEIPTKNVKLPKKIKRPHRYLTHQQLLRLANASGRYRTLILVLGFCGPRWGEATALRPSDIDFVANRISVSKSADWIGGKVHEGPVKTYQNRTIPMPSLVAEALKEQIKGLLPNDLVFTDADGQYVRQQSIGKNHVSWYAHALRRAGITPLKPHDLRHTAASIAIRSGASPKAVQRMLGHRSAAMTLDTYADLFDKELDDVSSSIDKLLKDES
ncbi:site-specific integrase [Bifidobacterium primatium]|uniref:Site-specific integrase n=1 Tax=Bifidobacterium primatium TaxID=2045438 RepID=A0A2M9HBJ4_9BIFI|nr:site-specific integrase [Bifidobacterium primatium]PJM74186.1 site-specific integrase [Bifidobacterium primatium]